MEEQHQGIVDRINAITNLLSVDKFQGAIEFYKREIASFVVWHLGEEERFMQGVSYPDLEEHNQHHKWIIYLFIKLGQDIQDKKQAKPALAMFTGWLYLHVGKRYGEFY